MYLTNFNISFKFLMLTKKNSFKNFKFSSKFQTNDKWRQIALTKREKTGTKSKNWQPNDDWVAKREGRKMINLFGLAIFSH